MLKEIIEAADRAYPPRDLHLHMGKVPICVSVSQLIVSELSASVGASQEEAAPADREKALDGCIGALERARDQIGDALRGIWRLKDRTTKKKGRKK